MGNIVPIATRMKTKDIKPREGEVIKPAEIIGIVGAEHWTLTDRLVWAALIKWAWGDRLEDPAADFTVPLAELRDMLLKDGEPGHESSDRIKESVLTIMRTVVKAATPGRKDSTRLVGLLSGLDIDNNVRDGVLTYSFDKRLIPILRESEIYARLEMKVMAAFTSKYSVAFYEALALRAGLRTNQARLPLGQFRQWLSVPDDKLVVWNDLNRKAIKIAVSEINSLSPFSVKVRPIKRGRSVTHVEITWDKKTPLSPEEQKAALEVNKTKVGRKARISGTVEHIPMMDDMQRQEGRDIVERRTGLRVDKYVLEKEWRNVVQQMAFRPDDLRSHWLAFCQGYSGE